MSHPLEFRVLGPLEIVADGQPVTVDAPKQRALAARAPVKGIKFVGDSHLIVIPEGGPGIVLETDTEKLIEIAKDRVVGEFTPEECEQYRIERCMPQPEEEPDED